MFRKLKKNWKDFLERLAQENEQEFGSKRADCCNLNKKAK